MLECSLSPVATCGHSSSASSLCGEEVVHRFPFLVGVTYRASCVAMVALLMAKPSTAVAALLLGMKLCVADL
jgi:hypothetical protein